MLRCSERPTVDDVYPPYIPYTDSGCGTGPTRRRERILIPISTTPQQSHKRGIWLCIFFLGSEQVKVTLFYVFIFFSTSPLGEDGMGRRHTFSVRRDPGKTGCHARCGPSLPTYLPTSYFYNYSPDGCDDTRVHGYISLGGGLLGLALLFLALGGGNARSYFGLDWCVDKHLL